MTKFKAAVVDNYIGAILIALIASSGVGSIAQALSEISRQLLFAGRDSVLGSRQFSPQVILFFVLHGVLYFAVAFLLLRWLYYPTIAVEDTVEEESTPEK
jgi:hypothetical protein